MTLGRIILSGLFLPLAVHARNPEILVNPQGLAQQDLSILGCSYDGAGLSVNGMNLKVPYSAHFNADLPLYGPLLSDPQIRSGPGNAAAPWAGTSSVEILPLMPHAEITFGLGTAERYRASTHSATENIGGYLDWEKARTIDYDANDLDRFTAGVLARFVEHDWQFELWSARQHKTFGAQGYYGIPAMVYAEERTDDNLLLATAFKGDLDGTYMRAGINLREFNDEYRIPSAGFENEVLSRYGSLMLEGRTLEIQNIALNLRGDLEHERISGDLGSHLRTRGSILILPEVRLERFTLKAGVNSVFQSDEAAEWLPQAGIDFFATDNLILQASCSETVRQPDFQQLYYADPYHVGNSRLGLQKIRSAELGLQQFVSARLDWRTAAFHRRQENAPDWIKATAADTAWTATNLGNLDVYGIHAAITYQVAASLKLQGSYQWIAKDEFNVYAGLYELDYPDHLLGFSGDWAISPEFRLTAVQTLRSQTTNPARTGDDFGAEASLGLHYTPHFANNMGLSFLVENLWGTDFQAIPGLKPRPTTFSTGITVIW